MDKKIIKFLRNKISLFGPMQLPGGGPTDVDDPPPLYLNVKRKPNDDDHALQYSFSDTLM